MNKYLSKIVGAIASLAMVIGVGVGIASNKDAKPIYAAATAASFSRTGTTNNVTGGVFSFQAEGKTGYYQDGSGTNRYIQVLSENAYWTTTPQSITLNAVIGGGTSDTDLDNAVKAFLLDSSGNVISTTETNITNHITTNTGDTYSDVEIPLANNVYGIRISHVKQTGYNVRYYSFDLSFVAAGSGPTYTVTYDANGGSGIMTDSSSPYASGATVTVKSNTFTREGYSFDHWDTLADGSGTDYASGATFNISANTTLYAQWTALPRTVTYSSNGATSGSAPTDATVYAENASVTVKGNTGELAKTGYIWGGWNTKADGTGVSYASGATFNISIATTLYARWINDYSNALKVDVTATYLNLPQQASAYTSEKTIIATDGMEYVAAPNGSGNKMYAINSGGSNAFDDGDYSKIFLGQNGAYLYNKDPFQKSIEKVEVFASANCSTKVSVAIDLGTTVRSSSYSTSPTTLETQNSIYTLRDNEGNNNYRYFRLQVTNANNVNIQIRITFYNPTTSVTVTPASITLNRADTQQLTTVIEPAGSTDEVVYESEDDDIATVSDEGLITAIAVGTTTITATSGSYSDTCEVTVELPATPYITPIKNSTSGYTGQSETISFDFGNLNSSVAVVSNNTSVVTISDLSCGATSGTVKFNFAGAGTTTVSFKDGSTEKASISVEVTQTTLSLNKSSTSIYVGKSETLVATTNIGGVTWNSNNAKISVDNGVVTVAEDAAFNSTATITATSDVDGSVSATCIVTALEDTRWNNNFTTTKVASIELPASGDTANKYYVVAEITSITNNYFGNGVAIDEDGTEFSIYGMYTYDGQIGYVDMPADIKPVVGDVVVLYGVFRNNEGPQIRDSRVIQRNGDIKFAPRINLDLSTDTTTSASTSLLTWNVSGQFSMQIAKGTAGTNTNNYYPGTAGHTYDHTRFYKNSVFTFTPASGVNVTKVSFYAATEGYATAFAGSAFTNATAVASGSLVVVTPVDGTAAFTATIGGTCGFTGIDMYFEQTIKQFIESDIDTDSSLSYTGYTDNGDDTFGYTNLAIRFKGIVDKNLWDILNAGYDIEGYGILFSTGDFLTTNTIMDFYNLYKTNENTVDEALAEFCDGTNIINYSNTVTRHEPALKVTPSLVGDNYVWALYLAIEYAQSLDDFSAVAYIKIDGGIVFLGEVRTYAAELAYGLIESGVYAEDALGGSLKYLAGRP